ncbi:MAG: hypothetical protein KDA75_11155, partial [Planctomycetaceae bacterium]|nr:hypothetical protein [Planctomycetaceae bacterium]
MTRPPQRRPVRFTSSARTHRGVVATAILMVLIAGAESRAEPTSIQEFISREPQYGDLVGSTFHLEGRASTLGRDELRMKGTDMKFVFAEDFPRPRKFPHVQLSGRLEREGRGFRFLVTSFNDYRSELDVIQERLRLGDRSTPKLYFDQARWADERGRFYEDPELREKARELRATGIEEALRRAKPDDPDSYLALTRQADEWGLDESLRRVLLHAASRAELAAER